MNRRTLIKRMIIMLIAVGVVFGAIVGFNMFRAKMIKQFLASQGMPPQTVTTMVAAYDDWQPQLSAIGTLRAVKGVDLSFEVSGRVTNVNVKSGQEVKEGEVLIRLYDVDETAKLRQLEAQAELARIQLARTQKQLQVAAVAQSQYDADFAASKALEAQVAQQKALIVKKTLTAPFSGRVGIVTVNPGQFANPGDKMMSLQQLDPIFIDFYLPQQELGRLKQGQPVLARSDAFPDVAFVGRISAVDPRVDADSRNVHIEALFPNGEKRLVPGMYATVGVQTTGPERHITLPQTSVTVNPYGDTAFIVEEGQDAQGKATLTAKQVFVTLGSKRGDQVAILEGIQEGQTVVTSGQLKLKNGTPIVVNNTVLPANDPSPKPQE